MPGGSPGVSIGHSGNAQLLSWVLWVLVWAAALLLATVLGSRAGRQWRERRDAKLLIVVSSLFVTAGLILLIGRGFGAFTRTDVEVDRRDLDIAPERAQAPADAGELFSRTVEAHRDKDNGEVHIDEMIGPDGTRRWIIYVPATTNFGAVPGEAGTDLTTNVETAAGQDTVMQETVRQAIADAGIDPDEEVMLVGYSQGGMTAASLAADAEFRSDVNVTSILTVGSPVGDAS